MVVAAHAELFMQTEYDALQDILNFILLYCSQSVMSNTFLAVISVIKCCLHIGAFSVSRDAFPQSQRIV